MDNQPYFSGEDYYAEDNFENPIENKKEFWDRKRIGELFIAGIFVILLIIMTLLFVGLAQADEVSKSSTTVSNSYNTNSYNSYVPVKEKTHDVVYVQAKPHYKKIHYPLKYYSWSEHRFVDSVFGDIDKYYVYVKNSDHVGGYYTVKFHFDNYYGDDDTYVVTHYVYPGQEKVFYHQQRYADDRGWNYKVVSNSKVSEKHYTYPKTVTKYRTVITRRTHKCC